MNFARNLRSTLSTLLLNNALGLALQILLARGLTEPERGVYAVAMTLALFVEFGSQLGQRMSVIYQIGRGAAARGVAVGAALAISLVALTGVGALCLLFAGPLRSHVLSGAHTAVLLAALAIAAVEVVGGLFESVARATDRFPLRNRAILATTALSLAAVGLALGPLHGDALAALLAVLAARAAVAAGLAFATLRETGISFRGIGPELGPALRFGFSSYLHTLISKLHERVDVMLLAALSVEPAQIAAYAIAVSVIDRLRVVPDAVGSALLPQLAGTSHAETGEFTARVVRTTLFWVGLCALGLAIAAPPFLPAIFGRGYAASLVPFWILLPATISLTFRRLLSNYFTASGAPGFNAAVQALALAVNVAVNLWTIPRLGIAGAALASLVSYGVEGTVTGLGFWWRSGVRPTDTMLPRRAEIRAQIDDMRRRLLGVGEPGS